MKMTTLLKKTLTPNNWGKTLMTALLFMSSISSSQGQPPTTVNCGDGLAYIVANGETGPALYSIPLSGTASPTFISGLGFIPVNGIGYNSVDDYMYAIDASGDVFRVGANGVKAAITINDPGNLLGTGYTAGDVANNGIYYIYNNTTKNLVAINLNASPATLSVVYNVGISLPSATGSIDDLVYNPVNSKIYAVTSTRELLEFDPATNIMVEKGTVGGALPTSGTKGTAFMDGAGNMYVGNNTNGVIYRIPNVATATSWTSTAYSNSFANLENTPFDGARCPSFVPPSANNDERELISVSAVELDIIKNTSPAVTGVTPDGAGSYPINYASVQFYATETGPLDTDGIITIANKGTYTLDGSTGIVTFTPVQGFSGEAVIWYTIKDDQGNISNRASIKVFVGDGIVLPVIFGAIEATVINDLLTVSWATEAETNNSHFEIEVSNDGKKFVKIGTVLSAAENGNSGFRQNYNYSTTSNGSLSLLGFSALAIGIAVFAAGRKKKVIFMLAVVLGVSLFGLSCSKNDVAIEPAKKGPLFVRIKQVDVNGKYAYSKVIQVIQK